MPRSPAAPPRGPAVQRLAGGIRARLRARRSIRLAVRGLILGAAAGVLLVLLERAALPRVASERVLPGALAAPLVGLALGAALGMRRRVADWEALALADRHAGTRELLLTAVDARIDESAFGARVLLDAEGVAATLDPRKIVPLALGREARVAVALLLVLGAVPFLPKHVPDAVARETKEREETSKAGSEMKEELQKIEAQADAQVPKEVEQSVEEALDIAADMEEGKLDRLTSLEKIGAAEDSAGRKKNELAFERVESAFGRAAKELEKQGLASELSEALEKADADAIEKELADLAKALNAPTELSQQEIAHIAEAFSRMAETLGRQGEQALSQLAKEIAENLSKDQIGAAAEALRKLASSEALEKLAKDAARSEELAKALDAAEETQPAVDQLRKQDAAGVEKALSELASSLQKGKSPKSFESSQQQSLAKAMKQLAKDLEGTELQEMAKQLREAAEALERGDMKAAAKALEKIQGQQGAGQCKGMAAGDARLQELSRVLAEARAMLGQGQGKGMQQAGAQPGQGKGSKPAADYGVGTSSEDQRGKRAANEHRDRDRTGEAKSSWSEKYDPSHPSVRLEGAQGNSTFVKSRTIGAASYVEFRGIPGQSEEPSIDMTAPPADYRKAAEDALTSEEIPPGYRKQVRQYFDDVPAATPGSDAGSAGKDGDAGGARDENTGH